MSIENDKLNSPISSLQMDKQDYSLRPKTLSEFIGQKKVCNNIKIFIEAAKKRTYNTTFRNTAPRMSTVRVPVSIPGAPCVQVEAVHTRKDRTHGLQE